MTRFEVSVKETELLISAERWLEAEAIQSVVEVRRRLEDYIQKDPIFLHTLKPHTVQEWAPSFVKEMAEAGKRAGVGPMAAVAGAIAEKVGRDLIPLSNEIIVENGGDIFIKAREEKAVMIYCESSAFESGIEIVVDPYQTPLGICTSSGTLGHSLSFGGADAVTVLAKSAALADAMATAVGNMIHKVRDIERAITFCQGQKDVVGVLIVLREHLGLWGDIRLLNL
jgi:ApbE superfamily uncharacterized protein (UPF0280 family)